MFMSFQFLSKADTQKVNAKYKQIKEAVEGVTNDETRGTEADRGSEVEERPEA